MTLWESVFAPSICERYFWRGVALLFIPVVWLSKAFSFNPLAAMDKIHKLRFDEPEEDFLLLAPLQACFLFALICPRSQHYWRLSRFDYDVSKSERKIIMHFYHRCLQKHIYYHQRQRGTSLRLLSKNPSFTSLIDSLQSQFSDCHIVACVRNPHQSVPSQLSSVEPALRLLYNQPEVAAFQQKMLSMLQNYLGRINTLAGKENVSIVDYHTLVHHLEDAVRSIYCKAAYPLNLKFDEELRSLSNQGRRYQSQHHYNLDTYQLNDAQLRQQFEQYWALPSVNDN